MISNSIDFLRLNLYRYNSSNHIIVLVLLITAISLLLQSVPTNVFNIAMILAIYKPGIQSKLYLLSWIAMRLTALFNSQPISSDIRLLTRGIIHNLSCLKEAILKLYCFSLLAVFKQLASYTCLLLLIVYIQS